MPLKSYRTTPKRVTDVTVRTDLFDAARAAGINLSAALERAY
jgi:post-segregation antitoxin (ccd killing protein)